MRAFGTDAPEFMSFTLGDEETVYKLPLAASLPMSVLLEMGEAASKGDSAAMRCQFDVLRRYMGERADELTAGQVREIFTAWTEESSKQGANPGE